MSVPLYVRGGVASCNISDLKSVRIVKIPKVKQRRRLFLLGLAAYFTEVQKVRLLSRPFETEEDTKTNSK